MKTEVAAAPNRSHAFALALFEELARSGLRDVCVCPGSRSAPLAVAAATHGELRTWSHIDERSAAFFALGQAKATRAPVALICTSGTAAANFHPAVIEAYHSRVPLIVLTADRPPELWDWGAGQTIDQIHLYGSQVRWFALAPPPEPGARMLRYARALASRAIAEAAGPPAGPVHLNLPFREPLDPRPVRGDVAIDLDRRDPRAARGRIDRPYTDLTHSAQRPEEETIRRLAAIARRSERGVIACGPMDVPPTEAEAIARLGAAAGWPLLAEPTSQLRRGTHVERGSVMAAGDLFLRDETFSAAHAPELVLQVGAAPTSKSLRDWIERHMPEHFLLLDPDSGWSDPSHLVSEVLRLDPAALCNALADQLEAGGHERSHSAWFRAFRQADEASGAAIEDELAAESEFLEAQLVRDLADTVPDEALVYVSNSMPIRELDAFLPASPRPLRVLCNRGANGIDGLVSSALGAAAGGDSPVVLLCGDLAFLHDLGGLVAAHRHGLRATIIVVNNDGGGIFSRLPIAAYGEEVAFEEHFRTPHGLDLGRIGTSFGAKHTLVSSSAHFRATLKDSLFSPGLSLIETRMDPERSLAQHTAIEERLRAGLDRMRSLPEPQS